MPGSTPVVTGVRVFLPLTFLIITLLLDGHNKVCGTLIEVNYLKRSILCRTVS